MGNNSVPKFIFLLSRFPVYRGSVLGRFYCISASVPTPWICPAWETQLLDSNWNVMAHGDAREGKWRGNWQIDWVTSTVHTTSENGIPSITTADAHTSSACSRLNWRPTPILMDSSLFAERRNLASARVPSHFRRSIAVLLSVFALRVTGTHQPLQNDNTG